MSKCRACGDGLTKVKEEVDLDLNKEEVLSFTKDSIKCEAKIDVTRQLYLQNELNHHLVKEELVEGLIKSEVLEDDCVLFNTDVPLCNEESISVFLFHCDECNYSTNDKQNLTDHVVDHRLRSDSITRDNSHIHDNTNNGVVLFTNEKGLMRPIAEITSGEQLDQNQIDMIQHSGMFLVCCDKCDFKTFSKASLRHHKKIHSVQKRYKCGLCDYSNRRLNVLKLHLMKHSGKYLFSCDKCDYKTCTRTQLKMHKLVHSEEKPYKCGLCTYSSRRPNHLKLHSMKHYGEQPFGCDECNYKTYTKSELKGHKLTHSEEKPFKCNLCDFSCKRKNNLLRHSKRHCLSFLCDKCDYRTHKKSILLRHKLVHSKEKTI